MNELNSKPKSESMSNNFLLDLQNCFIYQSNRLILQNISFKIKKGEFVYLVGKTGSGKTSLFKTLYADIRLKKGYGKIVGYNLLKIKEKDIPKIRRKIGIVFQDFQLLQDRTINENMIFVMKATGWTNKKKMETRINEVLDAVKMSTKGYKMPHELSGGEQQRAAIARSLINKPKFILADEPTGNLDPKTSEDIMNLLFKISLEGTSILMISHNKYLINKFPARTLYCYNSTIQDEPEKIKN